MIYWLAAMLIVVPARPVSNPAQAMHAPPSFTPSSLGSITCGLSIRPAHWQLGGERGGSCVRHALHARLPLGLHLALDLSPIDIRRRALFDPLHAELEEAQLPGLAVRRIGHFRPFPNDLRARSRIFQTPKDFTFFSFWINYGSKIFWSRTVL